MTVLAVHNFYQNRGGEANVFRDETRLLRERGHRVVTYTADNDRVSEFSSIRLGARTIWSRQTVREVTELIRAERPDVVHVHNTLPLISPSIYWAARSENVPVVQTLHNYRLGCPVGLLFRSGRPCEDCWGRSVPWPGVVHGCYRNDRAATAAVSAMLTGHRLAGTWTDCVDRYLTMTRFGYEKFVEWGLPAEKLRIKPHFVHPDPGCGEPGGEYTLFVGRLSREKGIGTLLDAWDRTAATGQLRIAGSGPKEEIVREAASRDERITFLGRLSSEEVYEQMAAARTVVVPSLFYETFGRVVIEAFSVGTAVVASGHGAVGELVEDGRTGRLFEPGDSEDLAEQIAWLRAHEERARSMGGEAREVYEARYTAERNLRLLLEIYEEAGGQSRPA